MASAPLFRQGEELNAKATRPKAPGKACRRNGVVEAGKFLLYFLDMQTMRKWLTTREDKIVVAFDICSSTTIIEDLADTDTVDELLDVLDGLKQRVFEQKKKLTFEPYKFMGDGWILLFPPETSGRDLIRLLGFLAQTFADRFSERRATEVSALVLANKAYDVCECRRGV